jgi:hypothetical protein
MTITRTSVANDSTSEIAILGRILSNGKEFAPALAKHILKQGFSEEDKQRINHLAEGNQRGALSASEQAELKGFADAGCLLGILHAKARRAVKKAAKK